MATILLVILATTLTFITIILSISRNHQSNTPSKITGISAILAVVGGILIYGYCYSQIYEDVAVGTIIALYSTIKIFLGGDAFSSVKNVDIMRQGYMIVLFWLIHFLALYTTTNVVLAALGDPLLNLSRIIIGRLKKKLVIIYGINDNSIDFGCEYQKYNDTSIVFIDPKADLDGISKIKSRGLLCYTSLDAEASEVSFLKKIGANRNKEITVYALSEVEFDNLYYAKRLLSSFESMGIESKKTSLTMIGRMEMKHGDMLQATSDSYGFGNLLIVNRAYLVAKTIVRNYPPCKYIHFDTENAKAKDGEVFSALIVGFGMLGQAVLKNLVINGQFEGCGFKAAVFDSKAEEIIGPFLAGNTIMDNYDVTVHPQNVKSPAFYEFLEKNIDEIDYIVVCTGDIILNAEIAGNIQSVVLRHNADADILQCTYDSIIHQHVGRAEHTELQIDSIYTRENLDIRLVDARAMQLNHIYCGGESSDSDWEIAGFVDRMSCRASADFAPSFLEMTGLTRDAVVNHSAMNALSEMQILNLSKTEHLRWCAFYYSIGYRLMPREEFEKRCQMYLDEVKEKNSSRIKIQKDDLKRYHTCLVPWDELDDKTAEYRKITGNEKKDYKIDDTDNVMMLPRLLEY